MNNNYFPKYQTSLDIGKIEQNWKNRTNRRNLRVNEPLERIIETMSYSNGGWKKYNQPGQHWLETKRLEMELRQRRNRLIWERMEKQNKESQDVIQRRKRITQMITKTQEYTYDLNEDQTRPSKIIQIRSLIRKEQHRSRRFRNRVHKLKLLNWRPSNKF